MIIFYGVRPYGKTRACGQSHLVTRFFHIWFLPLIPVGTQLVLEQNGDGTYQGLDVPFDWRSTLAGYLRVWGPIAVVASVLIGIADVAELSDEPVAMVIGGVLTLALTLALLAATVIAYAVVGKLSNEEKQKRSVYALHTGYFVDPGDMGMARQSIREQLLGTIAARARGLASMGYRGTGDPLQVWPHLALDPTHNDDALVTAAFTLARLDASLGTEPYRSQMGQLQEQLWQRIVRMNPPYLQAHLQYR